MSRQFFSIFLIVFIFAFALVRARGNEYFQEMILLPQEVKAYEIDYFFLDQSDELASQALRSVLYSVSSLSVAIDHAFPILSSLEADTSTILILDNSCPNEPVTLRFVPDDLNYGSKLYGNLLCIAHSNHQNILYTMALWGHDDLLMNVCFYFLLIFQGISFFYILLCLCPITF